VGRLACVDLPALPLQLLLREHPEWRAGAVAVVAEDRPQAPLLYVNDAARRCGVLPGQRFAAALGLASDLRAGSVSAAQVEDGIRAIACRLRRFSPEVEPDHGGAGTFWVDAAGLERLHPSLRGWSRRVAAELEQDGFDATVVVGFTRFGTYAVARSGRGVKVFATEREEQEAAGRVRLHRLDLEPEVRERLAGLGVLTVGELLRLPACGLRQRFGEQSYRLHRLAAGRLWTPLQPLAPQEPQRREADLEAPDADAQRLLFLVKRLLDELLAALARRGEAMTELRLHLVLDDGHESTESLRPAAPTLDAVQILGLVRLRLETLRLSAGVVELRLTARGVRAAACQLKMFPSRRDRAAAHRAFARLRAEFGQDVVARAVLREGHLPAARFAWEPLEALPERLPAPRVVAPRPLVRRIHHEPVPLPPRPRRESDGWLLRGTEHGRVERLVGPYVVSGGWWSRAGSHREYYFAEMSRGGLLWIYHDRRRRRFFLEGHVE